MFLYVVVIVNVDVGLFEKVGGEVNIRHYR